MNTLRTHLVWDIFCKVIDNWGDVGACFRLTKQLADLGQHVRLWVDDASSLAWMAKDLPEFTPDALGSWQVFAWPTLPPAMQLGDVVIEAFGCEINELIGVWHQQANTPEKIASEAHSLLGKGQFLSKDARGATPQPPVWINLEYLSAEGYVERSHALPSPVMSGAAAGLTKHFFYPGFTPRTGGLLREADLPRLQHRFQRAKWLSAALGTPWQGEPVVSVFCYESAEVLALLEGLVRLHGWHGNWQSDEFAATRPPIRLLVAHGKAQAAVADALTRLPPSLRGLIDENMNKNGISPGQTGPLLLQNSEQISAKPNTNAALSMHAMPALSQEGFDEMLWASDLNVVRGEDSLVRAIWAGKPFIWHIYPQTEHAHHDKLQAFLNMANAPQTMRQAHAQFNGLPDAIDVLSAPVDDARRVLWAAESDWAACAAQLAQRLQNQADLSSQLLAFVINRRLAH
jgi:uncharacterized repeat protein (TIGR03837 family)